MRREIINDLQDWQQSGEHLPLLLRGARQVGKSYIVDYFGKKYFESYVVLNFEKQPQLCTCFDNLEPKQIIEKIFLATGQQVVPGKTLLFLDEIQDCPQAILAMRYFKEEMPSLHVIGAGSLLEFALRDENYRMPVGRVKSLYLKPLSFQEYLFAEDQTHLVEYLQTVTLENPVEPIVHEQLIMYLRKYFFLGGMPAVINTYLETKNLEHVQAIQTDLMGFYRRDFGKYATKANHPYMQKVLERLPGLIGERCKYTKIDTEMRSRELKQAINYLVEADLIYKVQHTSASGLPLNSQIKENKFKLLLLDVGLANAMSFLSPKLLLSDDLMLINKGALAEQFVGQELLKNSPKYLPGELFYWEREKRGAVSEVDYIIQVDEKIIPVEVKASKTGSLKALQLFLNEKNQDLGLRLSLKPLSFNNRVLSIPLYMLPEIKRIMAQLPHEHS